VTSSTFYETEPFDRAAELVRSDPGVPLRRVEMLVAEQLLDLAKIRSGAEQLGGEDVAEGVRRDALPRGHACGSCIAKKGSGQDRLRQALALYADEERRLRVAGPGLEVLDEERLERGMDGKSPLSATLRLPHLQEPAFEVDVPPVETE
jgi:hypothetical protein